MSIFDSLRILGAMARVTAPTLVEVVRGDLRREDIDERTHWFARQVIDLLQIRLTATGAERVPTGRAYVYMSNHQSHLDIPMLYATLPSSTIRMLAKKELFQIPLWGRALRRAEFIEVDRGNHAKAVASIEAASELVRQGVSIWLAPEGSRSRDGRILPLKKGGFHLAVGTNTPIVPVAVRGTINVLPRGGASARLGQDVRVTIGDPIPVEGRDIDGLVQEVKEFLVANVEGEPGR
ncbi:MAG TPA: lysophospholipid acyltransferase family protein [Kofleriaceae bacterium]